MDSSTATRLRLLCGFGKWHNRVAVEKHCILSSQGSRQSP
jgi:hypothetical protein